MESFKDIVRLNIKLINKFASYYGGKPTNHFKRKLRAGRKVQYSSVVATPLFTNVLLQSHNICGPARRGLRFFYAHDFDFSWRPQGKNVLFSFHWFYRRVFQKSIISITYAWTSNKNLFEIMELCIFSSSIIVTKTLQRANKCHSYLSLGRKGQSMFFSCDLQFCSWLSFTNVWAI